MDADPIIRFAKWTEKSSFSTPSYLELPSTTDGAFRCSLSVTEIDHKSLGEGSDFDAAKADAARNYIRFLKTEWKGKTEASKPMAMRSSTACNYVSVLQEWTQKRGKKLPVYGEKEGEGTCPFVVTVGVEGEAHVGTGYGTKKAEAKQQAAKSLMRALGLLLSDEEDASTAAPDPVPAAAAAALPPESALFSPSISGANFVGKLQEWSQSRGGAFPMYSERQLGSQFFCNVRVMNPDLSAEGSGRNKKEAKQAAACEMLSLLRESRPASSRSPDADRAMETPSERPLTSTPVSSRASVSVGGALNAESSSGSFYSFSSGASPSSDVSVNYVGKVQEKAVRCRLSNPEYEYVDASGEIGFCVRVTIRSEGLSEIGSGKNKKEAKREAAKKLWQKMTGTQNDGTPPNADASAAGDVSVADNSSLELPVVSPPRTSLSGSGLLSPMNSNYVGELKEFAEKNSGASPAYNSIEGQGSLFGMEVELIFLGTAIRERGFADTKKGAKQEAARNVLVKLREKRLEALGPIGMVVGRSSEDSLPRGHDVALSMSFSSSCSSPKREETDTEIPETISRLETVGVEVTLLDLVEDLDLPAPKYVTTRKKDSVGSKRLFTTVIEVGEEQTKSGSGESKRDADDRAAHNMVQHLRCKYADRLKIEPMAEVGELSEERKRDLKGTETPDSLEEPVANSLKDFGSGKSEHSSDNYETCSEASSSAKKVEATSGKDKRDLMTSAVGNARKFDETRVQIFDGARSLNYPGKSLENLLSVSFESVGDKTLLMTQAQSITRDKRRLRRNSDPGKIQEIFYNENRNKIIYKNLEKVKELSDNWTKPLTRDILKDSGISAELTELVQKTASNKDVKIVSFNLDKIYILVLNFNPDYKEIETFQWHRKRRLDSSVVFHGRGSSVEEAETNALAKAAEHLKTIFESKRF